jgi:hypothetical protein
MPVLLLCPPPSWRHRNLVPRAQLPEPSTRQPEPRRDVDNWFGPHFAVQGLTSQRDSLHPHRPILDLVRRHGFARSLLDRASLTSRALFARRPRL